MKLTLILMVLAGLADGQGRAVQPVQTLGPYSASTNFTVDITGYADTRTDTWGTCGVQTWTMKFNPPEGYRVRVLHVRGDLIALVKKVAGQHAAADSSAGVLWGLQSTENADQGTSDKVQYSGEGTFLYVQGAVSPMAPLTRAVDFDTSAGGLLAADNTMVVKVASYLNDTGAAIHLEPTWTMTFIYEKVGQ